MSKVIHIRDVPQEVHEALTSAASRRGMSLSAFLRAELEELADRDVRAEENIETIRTTSGRIDRRPSREEILKAIGEGRVG